MSTSTILTLSNGKGIDLLNPHVEDIDFQAIAEHLGKEPRYNGATPHVQYSVAQHSSIGCDAILADGGNETEAAQFLLHDAKEALVKDLTTPLKVAVADIAEQYYSAVPTEIINSFEILEGRIDAAIYVAAGLSWPLSLERAQLVKKYDLIMFVTEWRDLMHDVPHPNWAPYSGIKPLPQKIEPLSWAQARAGWLLRANRLLPALRGDRVIIPPGSGRESCLNLTNLAHGKLRSHHSGTSE
jgi:5'-deoxynucleotidase YfbR-like HD superfamily hydrolase